MLRVFQPGSNWHWVPIVGIIYALIYYVVFSRYFTKKNLSIDVSDNEEEDDVSGNAIDERQMKKASMVVEGLGGLDNIVKVNNCISRLRVDLKDMSLVNEDLLKKTGSMGIMKPSETHIHVVYGPKVQSVADAVKEFMRL